MNQTVQLLDLSFELFIPAEKIQARIQEIGTQLATQFANKNPLFVGILNGSFILTADLVRACPIRSEVTFIKVSSYEGLESTGTVTTQLDFQQDIRNRHVILVEDIIDTGGTLANLLPTIEKKAPASVTLVSLLVKPTALQHPLSIDYVGFEIPDKFVVGYGMDYQEQGRNLSAIYQLKQ